MFMLWALLCLYAAMQAQVRKPAANAKLDSLYIYEVEDKNEPAKILHAEPLYIDLIRDLGARKGEKEWNFGFGLTDRLKHDRYSALVEYEFAPINRLGLEVEIPVTFYVPLKNETWDSVPSARVEALKMAAQYTLLVAERAKTSLALGYINELQIADIRGFDIRRPLQGNVFNPFLIVAKRWGNNFHTLLYTGPHITVPFYAHDVHTIWQINTNLHYMMKGTRNFIGLELNKEVWKNEFNITIRPQLRISITDNVLLGLVTGIPVNRENERFSMFTRLIYEPGHKSGRKKGKRLIN